MSMDIYIIDLQPFPNDYTGFRSQQYDFILHYLSKEQAAYLNSIVEGSAVPDNFEYIDHQHYYWDEKFINYNKENGVVSVVDHHNGESKVLSKDDIKLLGYDGTFVCIPSANDGTWDRHIFKNGVTPSQKLFWGKNDLPELLSYVKDDCKYLFTDLKDNQVIHFNY